MLTYTCPKCGKDWKTTQIGTNIKKFNEEWEFVNECKSRICPECSGNPHGKSPFPLHKRREIPRKPYNDFTLRHKYIKSKMVKI
jgi:hypothetical protein